MSTDGCINCGKIRCDGHDGDSWRRCAVRWREYAAAVDKLRTSAPTAPAAAGVSEAHGDADMGRRPDWLTMHAPLGPAGGGSWDDWRRRQAERDPMELSPEAKAEWAEKVKDLERQGDECARRIRDDGTRLRSVPQPGAEAGGWVACKTRLPTRADDNVLVAIDMDDGYPPMTWMAWHDGTRWRNQGDGAYTVGRVYAWQPRPLPPPPPGLHDE